MPASAAPSGATVTVGSGNINQSGSTTTVTQTTGKLAINWNSFSIQSGETVNFVQPGSSAIVLNRVTGGASSAILGNLNANGTVFILNPNGVLFGAGAQVNVGGLVASTLGMSDADFAAGRYALSGSSTASVTSQGVISVPAGGKVALIAASVNNAGTIAAPQGSVLLAGAGNVTLTLVDGSPLSYTISQGTANALVANGGLIQADGGHVVLTAQGLDALSQAVVNSTGVIQARTVSGQQGSIQLIGDPAIGTTQVSGTLDASAPNAGGAGGTVDVLGAKVGLFGNAKVDVSGQAGGGTALIGGNSRGAGPQPDASAAYVAPGATIDASATQNGNGGTIVVWGTDSANVYGTLLATGGAQSGNGGSIETSGHVLDTTGISVSVAAGTSGGTGGLWLLDPYNVTISTGTQTGGAFASGNVWTPSASGSLVNISSIQALLNSGSNVTITTTGAGTQEGNIAINGSIAKTAGGSATLTLTADGRITTNASSGGQRTISSTSGALNVAMTANATTSAANTSGISLSYLNISANGGNITATAAGARSGTAPALQLQNSTWTTSGSGTISLTGTMPSSGNSQGVYLKSTTLTTASGAISINGTSGGIATVTGTNSNGASLFSTSNLGIDLAGGNTIQSTGGGTIALTGVATGATSTWAGGGVTMSALDKLVTTGALTISGTATNPTSTTYRNQLSAVDIAGSSSGATLTGGTVTITGSNQVVGGASSTSNSNAAVKLEGNVNVTATSGAITVSGSNTGGDGVWGSSTGAVTMSAPTSSAVNITARSLDSVSGYSGFYIGSGTLTFSTAAPVSVASSSASSARDAFWNKGGLVVPGNLSITTTGGAVADNGTIGGYFHITGTTTIDSSGAGDTISLTNSGNAFNGTLSLTGADTTLANGSALTLGASTIGGALNLSAPGITQTGALSVSGTSTLNAGTSAITLSNSGNALSGAVSLAAGNATLVDGSALSLGASTLGGTLNLTAPGIAQTGAVTVSGTTTLNAGTSTIALTNGGNLLYGLLSFTAGNAAFVDATAVTLGASTASGTLGISAPGIAQSGALGVSGATTLNAGTSAITLNDSNNALSGAVSMTAGNATLTDSSALVVGTSAVSGSLNLAASGISQSGALTVDGSTTLNAGTGAITLTNPANDFSSLSVTGAAGASIANANGFTVTGIDSTGSVRLTTMNGDLNTQGNWSVSNGDLTLSAGASNARGTATGGDVNNTATFALAPGGTVTVYTGSMSSTVLGGSLAQRATSGSGDFRYDRQDGDAPGATRIGDGSTYVMYREQPVLTVTPTDAANTKVYNGSAGSDPQLAYSIAGQLDGDSAAQILTGSLARASGQNVGSHAISQGTLADQLGYQVVLAPGHTFGITPAALVITVNGASRGVGQSNPPFGVTYGGFVGGETAQSAGLQGTLSYFTGAGVTSPAGRYAIATTGLSSQNYSIRYVDGTLTVLPTSLSAVMLGSTSSDTSYLGAVADAEAKARTAGAVAAPVPAQKTRQGWRTAAAAFQFGDVDDSADAPPPVDRAAAPR